MLRQEIASLDLTDPIAAINKAAAMISQAKTLDETFVLKALFKEAELRARKRGLEETQKKAIEYQYWIKDRMGEILEQMKETGERVSGKERLLEGRLPRTIQKGMTEDDNHHPKTLKELGLSRKESSQIQQFHNLPLEKKKEIIDTAKRAIGTGSSAIRRAYSDIKTQKRKAELQAKADALSVDESFAELREGRFQDILSDLYCCIDVIFTDLPYLREFLPLYSDLSALASRVLKPNGKMFVMMGDQFFPEALNNLLTGAKDVKWLTHIAYVLTLNNSNSVQDTENFVAWKDIVVLGKKDATLGWHHNMWKLAVDGRAAPEKELHEWQQNPEGIREIIRAYTKPGEVILDPCMGVATFGVAALLEKRRFLGIEEKKSTFKTAKGRIIETIEQLQLEQRRRKKRSD